MRKALFLLVALFWPVTAWANPHQANVPLHDGRLSLSDLQKCLAIQFHLPDAIINHLPVLGSVDVSGPAGWITVRGLNAALGDGFQFRIDHDILIIQIDADRFPRDWDAASDALLKFAATTDPDAIALADSRVGLFLPQHLDPSKHLIILLHGLDGDVSCCQTLSDLLQKDGRQTAIFAYYGERPLSQSTLAFQKTLIELQAQYPNLTLDIVTESMGGLIARKYIEGPAYASNVSRFIMIAPPNEGSPWAKYSIVSKIAVDVGRYKYDPQWRLASVITEGLLQAGDDLKPSSKFLTELNAQPRRTSVKYTIVAGDRPIGYRMESDALAKTANLIPNRISTWWGIRHVKAALEFKSAKVLTQASDNDGPVPVKNTALPGVTDLVTLHADHITLFESVDGQPPAAWPVIRQRLEN